MQGTAGGGPEDPFDDGLDGVEDLDPTRLDRWLAGLRTEAAVAARTERHWLRSAAAEDASMAGVLLDLAEHRSGAVVLTNLGRRHLGTVAVVGEDFVAVRRGRRHVLLPLATVVAVHAEPGRTTPLGDRSVHSTLRLLTVITGLAADRASCTIVVAGAETLRGEVRSVGRDVVVLRPDPATPGPPVTIALAAIAEVAVDGPLA